MALQHLRSNTASKRPTPASMADGQLAINTNATSAGLFFKDAAGDLVKVGPVHVGTSAPNSSPAGSSGNALGEQWLDTSGGGYVFKVWDGSAWRSETGQFVDVTGDTMTGDLTISGADLVMSNGEIIAAAGTEAAPSITFTGDTNTGLYSPGADQVAISTNGTGRLFVDASGNVGFNATPETATGRTVLTSNGTSGNEIRLNTNGTQSLTLITASGIGIVRAPEATGYLRFDTGGTTERLRITSAGLVGIGTSAPTDLLHLEQAGSSDVRLKLRCFSAGGAGGGRSSLIGFDGDNATGANNYTYISDGTNKRLVVTNGGNVGIGTTSPAARLHVQGGIRSELASLTHSPLVEIGTPGGDPGVAIFTDEATSRQWDLRCNGDNLTINREGVEFSRWDSSGRLLVGTSSSYDSDSLFQVVGPLATGGQISLANSYSLTSSSITFGLIKFISNAGSSSDTVASIFATNDGTHNAGDKPTRLVFSTTADGASSPTERMRIVNGGAVLVNATATLADERFAIAYAPANRGVIINTNAAFSGNSVLMEFRANGTVGGSITFTNNGTSTAFVGSSDYRLKENIVTLDNGISRLLQLKPKRFNFIADPDNIVDGFIAHEAQEVVPQAVTGSKDEIDDNGNPVYQGIDQSKLVPLLTAALQEAVAKIETLEARLTAAGL